jgi:2-amino-4-hydroxy-6-hydroxymethyldihydropteridine diphosphokinase / dihydropteroate synthase
MSTQVPLRVEIPPLAPLIPTRKTHVMSILNLTPDSFSDGGQHSSADLSTLKSTISAHLAASATLIDIGGQSSRPGAVSISSEEELARILPAIQLTKEIEVQSSPSDRRVPAAISVDTYRADVAEAAVQAGAHVINDISAGTLDLQMLPTIARLGCTYILMHMRGTPETMTQKQYTTYDGDIIQIIGNELLERVKAAQDAGIRRWRIILDPGIGFAKTGKQNLEILRRFEELKDFEGLRGMPWLVGVSRKGFIGKITGVEEASARSWGTAAAVAAAVQGGADIVRVHDVDEMAKVVKMADAIWRS